MTSIEQSEKLFYSISEVAERLNVNQSLLRFWEKEFPSIRPTTNKKGNRMYTRKELEKIQRIYDLVKVQGFTLDGAKARLKEKNSSPVKVPVIVEVANSDIREKLTDIRRKLIEIRELI